MIKYWQRLPPDDDICLSKAKLEVAAGLSVEKAWNYYLRTKCPCTDLLAEGCGYRLPSTPPCSCACHTEAKLLAELSPTTVIP